MSNGIRLDLALNSVIQTTDLRWVGGEGYLLAEATWGGGNVKLQQLSPNGTYLDIPSATLSANGMVAFKAPPGILKLVITTATAVYAYAVK